MKTTNQTLIKSNTGCFILRKRMMPGKTRNLFFIALLFASVNYNAQSGITNLSFETWTTTFLGPAPAGWFGINASQQTTGAQHGNSYLRLSNNSSNGQGIIVLGSATSFTSIKGGVPLNQTPPQITGFYKTSGMNPGDSVGISSFTSKAGTFMGVAELIITSNKSSWTSFSMPFQSLPGAIDSLFLMGSSDKMSNGPRNSVSTLFDLDNLSLSIATGIDKNSLGTSFLVYPNPATSELNIISKDEKATHARIIGTDGRIIEELQLEMEKTRIDLHGYAAGIYFYSILDDKRQIILTNKFIVIN